MNQVADSLSRIDREDKIETITEVEVQAILDSGGAADISIPFVGISEDKNPIIMKNLQVPGMTNRLNRDWWQEQMTDKRIEPILSWKLSRRRPITKKDPKATKQLYKQRKNLVIQHGLLYRVLKHKGTGREMNQFVLPERFRIRALEACHDEFGHQRIDKTTLLLQKRFFWNNLVNETREHIRSCSRCLSFKTPEESANLERIEYSYPLKMIHLDFLSIGQTGKDPSCENRKPINVLVVTNHFTRFSQAYVTTNQTATVIAHTLWDKFISQYGWPEKILTDQGQCFESKLFQDLCTVSNTEKIRTCPYRPQGNGQVERFNKTLLNMIRTINPEEKMDWITKVQGLTHAYNCTSSQTTGYSPFFLFYGREPRIPIDVEFGLPESQPKETVSNFLIQLKENWSKLTIELKRLLQTKWVGTKHILTKSTGA